MTRPADLRDRAASLRDRFPERRRSEPPAEQGRRLATIPRPKDDEEIRLTWAEYEGHPFLSVRFWKRGDDGRFWPDKHRGFSIRLRELPDVAGAIAEALDLAEQHLATRPERPRQPARDGAPPRRGDGSGVPPRQGHREADRRPDDGFEGEP